MLSVSDFALSTMWNYPRAATGLELIRSIADAGFSKVELNYQVREELLPEALSLLENGVLEVVSLHNVFPKVRDKRFDTDSLLLGYPDEELRLESVRLTKRTVDWAARLGAAAVVVHPTEVPLDPDEFDRPLKQLLREGRRDSAEYGELLGRLLEKRQTAPYLEALKKSLDELCGYIAQGNLKVSIGLENRSMCHQIPLFQEFEAIFSALRGGSIGIWLDTGHGIMMEELGLQRMPLPEALRKRVLGLHIHDAREGRDHYPPGMTGNSALASYYGLIAEAPLKVLEISSRFSVGEVSAGARWLAAQLNVQVRKRSDGEGITAGTERD